MKRGDTEAETLELNGWKEGDILYGDEGYGVSLIKITRIGEEKFLCRWHRLEGDGWEEESGHTTLNHREWIKL